MTSTRAGLPVVIYVRSSTSVESVRSAVSGVEASRAGEGAAGAAGRVGPDRALAADGLSGVEIAERVGCSEPTVVGWRSRFAEHGLAGLDDAPRSGEPPQVPAVSQRAVVCRWV
jgi:hypothetical protein